MDLFRKKARHVAGYSEEDDPESLLYAAKQLYTLPVMRRRSNKMPQVVTLVGIPCLILLIATFSGLMNYSRAVASNRFISATATIQPTRVVAAPKKTQKPPTGTTTIVVLGSDQREGDPGFRTDVILLVHINADKMKVNVVSFPRDLWVSVPGLYEMKINQVQALGGFKATADMFEANFGIRPKYYLLTNFDGFTGVIDRLGGVEVTVAQALTDDCDLPQAVDGDCTVLPGTHHMDGATALWYVRSRYSSSDFDRLRRAQEVAVATFSKLMSLNAITKIPELQADFSNNVKTNLDVKKVTSLLPVGLRIYREPERIKRFAITEEQATPSWSWNGLWILLPDKNAIHEILVKAGMVK